MSPELDRHNYSKYKTLIMYKSNGLKYLDDKNSSNTDEEEEKPQLIQELKKLMNIRDAGDSGKSTSTSPSVEEEPENGMLTETS